MLICKSFFFLLFNFMARKGNSLFQKLLISNSNVLTRKTLEYGSIQLVNQPFLYL